MQCLQSRETLINGNPEQGANHRFSNKTQHCRDEMKINLCQNNVKGGKSTEKEKSNCSIPHYLSNTAETMLWDGHVRLNIIDVTADRCRMTFSEMYNIIIFYGSAKCNPRVSQGKDIRCFFVTEDKTEG